MQVKQFQLVGLGHRQQFVVCHLAQLLAVDDHEAAQCHFLAARRRHLHTRGLEHAQLFEPLAKRPRALEMGLEILQELQHPLRVGRGFALSVEQALALALAVEPGVRLVDAQRERLAVGAGGEHEGVAADEGRHVLGAPLAVGAEEQVLVGAHA